MRGRQRPVFAQTVVGEKLPQLGESRMIKKIASNTREGESLDKGFVGTYIADWPESGCLSAK